MPSSAIYYFTGASASDPDPDDGEFPSMGPLRADGLDAVLTASRGLDAVYPFTIRAIDPTVELAFDGTETIAGRIWAGQDGPPLADLAGAWVDAEAGRATVTLPAAVADLDPGTYNVLVTIEADGATYGLHSGLIRVHPAPGTAADPDGPLYCTYEEVAELADRIDDLRQEWADRARMDRAIARASRRVDETVMSRASHEIRGGSDAAWPASYPWMVEVGTTPAGWLADVRQALADGRLEVTPRIREATARMVLSKIPGVEGTNNGIYAHLLLTGAVFRLDLDDDGDHEVELIP
jgi:hypothetical protein